MVPLDSDYCAPHFISSLKAVLEERERAGLGGSLGVGMEGQSMPDHSGSLGVGVLSMLGFESTRRLVEVGGVAPWPLPLWR